MSDYKPSPFIKFMARPRVVRIGKALDAKITWGVKLLAHGLIDGMVAVVLAWIFGIDGDQRDWLILGMVLVGIVWYGPQTQKAGTNEGSGWKG